MGLFSFFKSKDKSKNVAKERLKLVLVQDRSDISPILLDKIESELMNVVSKYIEVDGESLDLKLTRMKKEDDTTMSALVVNIPFTSTKE